MESGVLAWIFGAATGAVGSGMAHGAEQEAGRVGKIAADTEALQLDRRADDTRSAGTFNAQRIKREVDKILSSQRARAAATGNDTTGGSFAEIEKETIQNASIDQLLVMMDAENEARKDEYAAKVTRTTGKQNQRLAESRATARGIQGVSTLLDGAADWKSTYG